MCKRMSLRVIGLWVRAAVQVGNLSTLWVFFDFKWVDHWNKTSNRIVVLALSEGTTPSYLLRHSFFFVWKGICGQCSFFVNVSQITFYNHGMSSRSCESIFAFVTHCMLRPDNFSTRKSGNTLGRFLMSLNNVEEQTLLSTIKVMQKCWQKTIKKHKLHEGLATLQWVQWQYDRLITHYTAAYTI